MSTLLSHPVAFTDFPVSPLLFVLPFYDDKAYSWGVEV